MAMRDLVTGGPACSVNGPASSSANPLGKLANALVGSSSKQEKLNGNPTTSTSTGSASDAAVYQDTPADYFRALPGKELDYRPNSQGSVPFGGYLATFLKNQSQVSLIVVIAIFLMQVSYAADFIVGGTDGWVPVPSEPYAQWAERQKFFVNDTLIFDYWVLEDSVEEVSCQDYGKCIALGTSVFHGIGSGQSKFQLNHPGWFYFISGKRFQCLAGEKLAVWVRPLASTPVPPSPEVISGSTRVFASTVTVLSPLMMAVVLGAPLMHIFFS